MNKVNTLPGDACMSACVWAGIRNVQTRSDACTRVFVCEWNKTYACCDCCEAMHVSACAFMNKAYDHGVMYVTTSRHKADTKQFLLGIIMKDSLKLQRVSWTFSDTFLWFILRREFSRFCFSVGWIEGAEARYSGVQGGCHGQAQDFWKADEISAKDWSLGISYNTNFIGF